MNAIELSYDSLKEMFVYDPISGTLTWKNRPRSAFLSNAAYTVFNKRFAAKKTGCACYNSDGTRKALLINIRRRIYKAHRIAWVLAHKQSIPYGYVIDHANRDPFDNRLENLRLCTISENNRNCKARKHNVSRFKGVSVIPGTTRFTANISNEGAREYIGSFDNEEEAQAAYLSRAKEICGEFATI